MQKATVQANCLRMAYFCPSLKSKYLSQPATHQKALKAKNRIGSAPTFRYSLDMLQI